MPATLPPYRMDKLFVIDDAEEELEEQEQEEHDEEEQQGRMGVKDIDGCSLCRCRAGAEVQSRCRAGARLVHSSSWCKAGAEQVQSWCRCRCRMQAVPGGAGAAGAWRSRRVIVFRGVDVQVQVQSCGYVGAEMQRC